MWPLWILGIVSSLGLVGAVAAVILVPGVAIPVLQAVVRAVLKCKPCLAVLAAIALLFAGALYGVHVEKARCETRIERLKQAATAAAAQRDADIRADLERHYRPQISALEQRANTLKGEVDRYEKSLEEAAAKQPSAAGGRCVLGTEPLRLRRPQKN